MPFRAGVLCLSLFAAASPALAQKTVTIDMRQASAPAPKDLLVGDRDRATVLVEKNVFHTCTIETKTEALPAPVSPVAQVLSALGGFIGGGGTSAAPPAALLADPLGAQVEALLKDIDAALTELEGQLNEVRTRANGLTRVMACGATPDPCRDASAARDVLGTMAEGIDQTPRTPVASTALLTSRAAELAKAVVARSVKEGPDPALPDILKRMREAQARLDFANGRRDAIVKARDALLVIRARVLAFTPATSVSFPLSPAANAKTTATVTCLNVVTEQPVVYRLNTAEGANPKVDPPTEERLAPVSVAVVFRDVPWATVTAGLLASSVDKREIGIETYKTGTDATGTVTVARRVAVVEEGDGQLVPFTFFNAVIPRWSSHRVYVAGTVGFGLNPHNGPRHLEYFLGGAVGLGRFVALTAGWHMGTRMEPDNDFEVDDVLPAAVTAVPTRRERKAGFAIAVSYGVPLPK